MAYALSVTEEFRRMLKFMVGDTIIESWTEFDRLHLCRTDADGYSVMFTLSSDAWAALPTILAEFPPIAPFPPLTRDA